MKRTSSTIMIVLLIGLTIGLLINGNPAIGQGNGNNLSAHRQEVSFTMTEDIIYPLTLPKSDVPVLVTGSVSNIVVDGQPRRSVAFSGTFFLDSTTNQITGSWNGFEQDPVAIVTLYSFIQNGIEPSIDITAPGASITQPALTKLTMWY